MQKDSLHCGCNDNGHFSTTVALTLTIMTLTAIVTTERNATQRQRATIPKLIVDTIGLAVFASVGSRYLATFVHGISLDTMFYTLTRETQKENDSIYKIYFTI